MISVFSAENGSRMIASASSTEYFVSNASRAIPQLWSSCKWFITSSTTGMLLSLMDDPTKLPIAGTVVWITPAGAQNSKAQGIGVHFKSDESGVEAKRKIEALLGGVMQSTRPTHTM